MSVRECIPLLCSGKVECTTDCHQETDCTIVVTCLDSLKFAQEGSRIGLVEVNSGVLVKLLNCNEHTTLGMNLTDNHNLSDKHYEYFTFNLTDISLYIGKIGNDAKIMLDGSEVYKNTPITLLANTEEGWYYLGFDEESGIHKFLPFEEEQIFSKLDTWYLSNPKDYTDNKVLRFGQQIFLNLQLNEEDVFNREIGLSKTKTLARVLNKRNFVSHSEEKTRCCVWTFSQLNVDTDVNISLGYSCIDVNELSYTDTHSFQITWASGCLPPKIGLVERKHQKSTRKVNIKNNGSDPESVQTTCEDCVPVSYRAATWALLAIFVGLIVIWGVLYWWWNSWKNTSAETVAAPRKIGIDAY